MKGVLPGWIKLTFNIKKFFSSIFTKESSDNEKDTIQKAEGVSIFNESGFFYIKGKANHRYKVH